MLFCFDFVALANSNEESTESCSTLWCSNTTLISHITAIHIHNSFFLPTALNLSLATNLKEKQRILYTLPTSYLFLNLCITELFNTQLHTEIILSLYTKLQSLQLKTSYTQKVIWVQTLPGVTNQTQIRNKLQ